MFLERYARQIAFDHWSEEDQKKLGNSTVAIIGLGALGSWSCELLVRAGIGKIILIDRDIVELQNLQRQNYAEEDVGFAKAEALKKRLEKINKEVPFVAYVAEFDANNAEKLVQDADLILDGTDNFDARYIINDAAKKHRIPWIYAGAIGSHAALFPIRPWEKSPCFQCLFGIRDLTGNVDTCETSGILNSANVTAAAHQVVLAMKLLAGKEVEPSALYFDLWGQSFSKLRVKQRKECESCKGTFVFLKKRKKQIISLCGKHAYHVSPEKKKRLDLKQMKKKFGDQAKIHGTTVLKYKEVTLFADGRAIIEAPTEGRASSLYSEYVGQ